MTYQTILVSGIDVMIQYWVHHRMITTIGLVSICHNLYFFSFLPLFDSLSNFPVCARVLTVVSMLYIKSPWHFFSIGSLYFLILFTHFTHPPILTPSGNHQYVLYICELSFVLFFTFHIKVRPHGICLTLSDLFQLA